MSRRLAAQVVRAATGEVANAITALPGGQVGRVYRADTPSRTLVVKFVRAVDEPSFADEPPDNRVYGARWSNLGPAHAVLAAHGVKIPALYATGDLDAEGLRYAVMAYLEGDADDYSPGWFSAVGQALGSVHQVARGYQGWVALDGPLADDWSTAFGKSLGNRLQEAAPLLAPSLHRALSVRVGEQVRRLRDPGTFVLSHTDGFQGVLSKSDDGWACLGHIDVEDFQYTDQRFVLAGLELAHALAGRSVPGPFWNGYLEAVDLAPGYDEVRDLFQAYYLIVWITVLQGQAPLLEPCIRHLETILG
jgi:Ser/Thr protein kinase RdoA (MazF antagonist)